MICFTMKGAGLMVRSYVTGFTSPLKMASIVSGSLCKFVSYNLHGLNSGRSFLTDLCCDDNVAVIAVQEHWLSNSNLHLLNSIHSDFLSIGISAMTKRLSKEIYLGRPYGGVAFLFRRHFANKISVVASDDNGRCLVISLKINDTLTVKLVNVYFPCADGSVSYKVELGNCLGLIENAVSAEDKCIVLGDMNFECVDNNVGFKICRPVFEQLGLCNCDHLCTSKDRITYNNTALMASSFIDHIFVSDCLLTDCSNIDIIDSGCNLSDHRPIIAMFTFDTAASSSCIYTPSKHKVYNWRWDKSNINDYYEASRVLLSHIEIPACVHCNSVGCCDIDHLASIDRYYCDIVNALYWSASANVVRVSSTSLKPYWNEHLDNLKQDSIFWHNLWLSAGKPHSGSLQSIAYACKMKYKSAIRDAYARFEAAHDDAIMKHFANKDSPEFWKAWSAKFRKNICSDILFKGCRNDIDVANMFAEQYSSVFYDSYAGAQSRDVVWNSELSNMDDAAPADITVDLIDNSIRGLKRGKACGPDDLGAEHLLNAHPSLVIHLKILFSMILCHSYVPLNFGLGTIIPLVKDKSAPLSDPSNYRAITLVPVICKVFESVILSLCDDALVTNDLQFGFKKGSGCPDALFTLRCTIDHFIKNGSNVYAASLDISKAFDRVSHPKLFCRLREAGVPIYIVAVVRDWYGKMCSMVRWNGVYSSMFYVRSGVRQGSTLSPALFNLFINVMITCLKSEGVGCWVQQTYVGCILYADDIMLLSPSRQGLQDMLNICHTVCDESDLQFNASKCHLLAFGYSSRFVLNPLKLGSDTVHWSKCVKYLGVHLVSGRKLSFDVNPIRRSFFAACNAIYSQSARMDNILQLSLMESYCLPILTYAASAVTYKTRQLDELNSCWNSVYRKIFGFNRWESVRVFINGLGRLDLKHIYVLCKCRWIYKARHCTEIIQNLIWTLMLDVRDSLYLFYFQPSVSVSSYVSDLFSSSCIV